MHFLFSSFWGFFLSPANIFKRFCLTPAYNVNKNDLRQRYFELCRVYHPDVTGDHETIKEINLSYKILNNDYERARLLNNKIEEQSPIFLLEILELEGDIEELNSLKEVDKMKEELIKKINECKQNYKDSGYLSRWVYYERLLKNLKEREIQLEIEK